MDTHSRKKKHQTENNADGAGPVPETRPDLTGITWQKEADGAGECFFLADENATENFGALLGRLAADLLFDVLDDESCESKAEDRRRVRDRAVYAGL